MSDILHIISNVALLVYSIKKAVDQNDRRCLEDAAKLLSSIDDLEELIRANQHELDMSQPAHDLVNLQSELQPVCERYEKMIKARKSRLARTKSLLSVDDTAKEIDGLQRRVSQCYQHYQMIISCRTHQDVRGVKEEVKAGFRSMELHFERLLDSRGLRVVPEEYLTTHSQIRGGQSRNDPCPCDDIYSGALVGRNPLLSGAPSAQQSSRTQPSSPLRPPIPAQSPLSLHAQRPPPPYLPPSAVGNPSPSSESNTSNATILPHKWPFIAEGDPFAKPDWPFGPKNNPFTRPNWPFAS